jgi:hypothetical protein
MIKRSPFRCLKTSAEFISLAVTLHIRFPLSLRNVEDLLHERGIEISDETVRFWWNRFGPMFAAKIRLRRLDRMSYRTCQAGALVVTGFLHSSTSMWGQDEPQTPCYTITPNCFMGADGERGRPMP